MTVFYPTVTLKGANNKLSRIRLVTSDFLGIDVGADLLTAIAAMGDFVAALQAVSEATVVEYTISLPMPVDDSVGAGDVFEKALTVLRIPHPDNSDKTTNFYIPAPVIGIFEGATGVARDRVDITDADLIALVDEIAANFTVSDGETVDQTVTNGIAGGRRVVTRMKLGE